MIDADYFADEYGEDFLENLEDGPSETCPAEYHEPLLWRVRRWARRVALLAAGGLVLSSQAVQLLHGLGALR